MKLSGRTLPFLLRIKALMIDYLVICGWMACLAVVGVLLAVVAQGYPDFLGILGPFGTQGLFFMLLTLPAGMYLYLTETSRWHASLGKRIARLKVVGLHGNATKRQIAVRTVIKLVPWEIAHTFVWQLQNGFYVHGYDTAPALWVMVGLNGAMVLSLGYVGMIAMRKDGRGPHDIIAGTQVVLK